MHVDGTTTGPHPAEHVTHWLQNRQLPDTALFWPDGGAEWLGEARVRAMLIGRSPGGDGRGGAGDRDAGQQPTGARSVDHRPGEHRPADHRPADHRPPGHHPDHADAAQRGTLATFTHALAHFAGVQPIQGFRLGELLSLATRRHTRDEIERNFATGVPGFTPDLADVESDWPKPWMFVRFYAAASALFLGFLGLYSVFHNTNLIPGMIMVGSFVVPVAVLVFFFETNTPRNVSLYVVGYAFLTGGLISIAIALVLIQFGGSDRPWVGPLMTGVLEETGKLLAVAVIALRMPGLRYPWILNGMLFGAAVGAGFGAFESAGYALSEILRAGGTVSSAVNVILLRGGLAPFGHVVWTALVGGALWRAKRERPISARVLLDVRVLLMLLMVIAIHSAWDVPLQFPMVKYLALGLLAWLLVLGMITSGLKQIKATQASAAAGGSSLPMPTGLQPVVPPALTHRTAHPRRAGGRACGRRPAPVRRTRRAPLSVAVSRVGPT